jgi:protein required for attachment to host cells
MPHRTWIVVADGARGRVFAYSHRTKEFDSALGQDFVGSRLHVRDRVTDRGGQTFESHGEGGHSKAKAQDAKEHRQEELAREIAGALTSGRNDKSYDELVLVAPPAFLGLLRQQLDAPTLQLVVASHDKDLSKLKEHELAKLAPDLVPRPPLS